MEGLLRAAGIAGLEQQGITARGRQASYEPNAEIRPM
jgi:hypothetical protein